MERIKAKYDYAKNKLNQTDVHVAALFGFGDRTTFIKSKHFKHYQIRYIRLFEARYGEIKNIVLHRDNVINLHGVDFDVNEDFKRNIRKIYNQIRNDNH